MDWEAYRATTAKFEALPGFVTADTLPEYRVVLEAAGLEKEEVEEILAHENEHMVVAHSIPDVQRKYRLQFMKAGEDQLAMIPSVRIDWLDNLSEDEVRSKLQAATEAPENLSEGDKEMLGGRDLASQ